MVAKASAVSTHRIVQSRDPVDASPRDYLTEREMELFCKAAKHGRHGARDYAMVLLAYRHGLRVSELVEMRLDQLDWHTAHLWVARKKGSLSTQHPLAGDELRALRAWCRTRVRHPQHHLPYVFLSERGPCTRQMFNYLVAAIGTRAGLLLHVHPHMLRHSCGYALANQGRDTRLIQDYLGHRNVQHTVRYTRTAAARFEGLWRSVEGRPMSDDDTDGYARTQTQSAALRAKAWTSLDIAHVAEAIETIGMHEKRAMSRQ